MPHVPLYRVYRKKTELFKFKLATTYCCKMFDSADCFELMIRKNKRSCTHLKLRITSYSSQARVPDLVFLQIINSKYSEMSN